MKTLKLPLLLGITGSLLALGLGYGLGKAWAGRESGSTHGTHETVTGNGERHQPVSALGSDAPTGPRTTGSGLPGAISSAERWDVEQLVAYAMDEDKNGWGFRPDKTPLLLELARHVRPADIPQLLEDLEERLPIDKFESMQRMLCCLYARADPQKAWDLVRSREEKARRGYYLDHYVMSEWLEIAPYEALQAARSIEDKREFQNFYSSTLHSLANTDPLFVWRELEADSGLDEHQKNYVRREVLENLAREDMSKAIAMMEGLGDEDERAQVMSGIAGIMLKDDLDGALEFLTEHSSNSYEEREAKENLVNNLVHQDVELAMKLYTELGLDQSQHWTASNIARQLAEKDPERSWEWLQTLPLQAYEAATQGFAQQIDIDDPQPTLDKLLTIKEDNIRIQALTSALNRLGREDPRATLELIEAQDLAEGPDGERVLGQIYREWASKDGEQAARELMKYAHGQEDFPKGIASEVVQGWAEVNPRKALEWTLQLPEDTHQDLVNVSVRSWAEYDLDGAGEWINTLGDGKLRDGAIDGFINQVRNVDHLAAMEWAGSITDENLRNNRLISTGRRWKSSDPQAAMDWLKNQNLPEKVKKQLLPEDD